MTFSRDSETIILTMLPPFQRAQKGPAIYFTDIMSSKWFPLVYIFLVTLVECHIT